MLDDDMVASENGFLAQGQTTTAELEGLSLQLHRPTTEITEMISEEEGSAERFKLPPPSDHELSGDEASIEEAIPAPDIGPAQQYDLLLQLWQGQQAMRRLLDEKLEALVRDIANLPKRLECGHEGKKKTGDLQAELVDSKRLGEGGFDELERQVADRAMKHQLSNKTKRRGSNASSMGSMGSNCSRDAGQDSRLSGLMFGTRRQMESILPHIPADAGDENEVSEPSRQRTRSLNDVAALGHGAAAGGGSSMDLGPVPGKQVSQGSSPTSKRGSVKFQHFQAESSVAKLPQDQMPRQLSGPSPMRNESMGGASDGQSDKCSTPQAARKGVRLGRSHSVAALRPRPGPNSEVSLSKLFQRRESQCIQGSFVLNVPQDGSNKAADDVELQSSPSTSSEAPETKTKKSRLMGLWVSFFETGVQLCGLTPWARDEFADGADPDATDEAAPATARWRKARVFSRLYHCCIVLLNAFFLILSLNNLVCSEGEAIYCTHQLSLVTDVVVALGSLFAVWTCGGLLRYDNTAEIQVQTTGHLADYVNESSLDHQWLREKGRAALMMTVAWLCAVSARSIFMITEMFASTSDSKTMGFAILSLVLYSLSSACLLNACYIQMSMWRGLSLTIVAFARSVLEGEISCQAARAKWREVISCMRHTSRMYQLTAAVLALTTVLVFFGTLADVEQERRYAIIPNLLLALSLPGSLVVAATATAHCTRLPSLVSMLDGNEEEEAEYMGLAMFLTLSESGFFMWDTRVTLGVVQRFLYFTLAIFGTIGFQTKVLSLASFG